MKKAQRQEDRMQRGAGILLSITSLPSPHGIGTIGREAYDFVDLLAEMKQSYWQEADRGHRGDTWEKQGDRRGSWGTGTGGEEASEEDRMAGNAGAFACL